MIYSIGDVFAMQNFWMLFTLSFINENSCYESYKRRFESFDLSKLIKKLHEYCEMDLVHVNLCQIVIYLFSVLEDASIFNFALQNPYKYYACSKKNPYQSFVYDFLYLLFFYLKFDKLHY